MSMAQRQIVAFGGGGFSMEAQNPLLDDYVLELTGVPRPRVCFLPSASGDADHYIVRFYRTFAGRAETSHMSLFRRDHDLEDLHTHLLAQDAIYVGGGSVVSLMGVWRAHGLDAILREAWEAGVILCGVSAGSLCWFAEGVSAFHGTPQPYRGLGLAALEQHRPLRRRPSPRRRLPRAAQAGDGARVRRLRRQRAALRGRAAGGGRCPRGRARRRTGWRA